VLDPKHLNEQGQKDAKIPTRLSDREVESAFSIDKSDNNLKTPNLKQTLKDLLSHPILGQN
jgi:hypothetical protein